MVDKVVPGLVNPSEVWSYEKRELTKYRIGEWLVPPTPNTNAVMVYRGLEPMWENMKLIAMAYGNGKAYFGTRENDIMHTSTVTYDPNGDIVKDSGRGNEIDLNEDTYYYVLISPGGTIAIYDLGKVYDTLVFFIDDAEEPGYSLRIGVAVSSDGSTWTEVYSRKGTGRKKSAFSGSNVRYVKLYNPYSDGGYNRIYSLECFIPEGLPLFKTIQGDNTDKYVYFLSDGNSKSVCLLRVIEV